MNPNQLDPKAVSLAKAMRQVESGGDFQIEGKSGEYGAYQFTEPTWNAYAKEAGVNVPLRQATPDQQNEVAYKKIKQLKDAGHNVGEIASIWNAGDKDAYLKNHVGTNKLGVSYDTPAYAKKVAEEYQKLKGTEQGYNPKPFSSGAIELEQPKLTEAPTKAGEEGIGAKLRNRMSDASKALSEGSSGKINPLSGLLQATGAGAGAIGDITESALNFATGGLLRKGMDYVGKNVVQPLAETSVGQSVIGGAGEFAKAHPEIAGDIGAVGNIVSALPALKGGQLALKGTKGLIEKASQGSIKKEMVSAANRTQAGRDALKSLSKDDLKALAQDKELRPLFDENYKYTPESIESSKNVIKNRLTDIEDNQLQPALQQASQRIADRQLTSDLRKEALKQVAKDFKASPNLNKAENYINNAFDNYDRSFNGYVSINDVNDLKRGVSKTINDSSFADPDLTYAKSLRNFLQKNVEDNAEKLGLADVHAINQKSATLKKMEKLLEKIESKKAQVGLIRKATKQTVPFVKQTLKKGAKTAAVGAIAGLTGGASLNLLNK